MDKNLENFIQSNSPDGGFLQSEEWREFQESVGRKTFNVSSDGFWANIVEHQLPIAGKYFYIPRGPIIESQKSIRQPADKIQNSFSELIKLAKENSIGWTRVEPENEEILNLIKKVVKYKIAKAPHDMQPKEILVMDITKSEEELLAEMKPKTRYNIKLSQKHGVIIKVISKQRCHSERSEESRDLNSGISRQARDDIYYIDEFIKLVKITTKRDKITPHPENYYRKMFETISSDILKLYVAEHEDKIIAANLMIFFGKTAIYLHGASDNKCRNLMAPYLLQWQAIKDAKAAGCEKYDFGGVNTRYKIQDTRYNSWSGITKFKTGFAPSIKPVEFSGAYDIVLNPIKYYLYRAIQKLKWIL